MIHRLRRSIHRWLKSRGGRPMHLDLSELLNRPAVNLATPELQRFLAGKVVMVTGAGGSIGSEICRQSMKFCPSRLVLLDRAENALFEIDQELNHRWVAGDIMPVVADICDQTRIEQVFEVHRPQVIFHAAAHKHVPMMELNPGEAVKNNVFGTKVVADAAARCAAHSFVMVSTDKAVNPTSVMGATKRAAELYVQSLNPRKIEDGGLRMDDGARRSRRSSILHPPSSCRFVAVRFGNVLGSSGSVVPIFQKQIEAGGPVTITHPEMQRFFMTIPEASQLVMQAGAIGQGGEILVLDMGRPIRILDLALELIRRRGLAVGRDIQIEFTGIRPGEKLYEELAFENEQTLPTSHEKIRVWQLPRANSSQIRRMVQRLEAVINGTPERIIAALAACIPEYLPDLQGSPGHDQARNLRLLAESQRTAKAA